MIPVVAEEEPQSGGFSGTGYPAFGQSGSDVTGDRPAIPPADTRVSSLRQRNAHQSYGRQEFPTPAARCWNNRRLGLGRLRRQPCCTGSARRRCTGSARRRCIGSARRRCGPAGRTILSRRRSSTGVTSTRTAVSQRSGRDHTAHAGSRPGATSMISAVRTTPGTRVFQWRIR